MFFICFDFFFQQQICLDRSGLTYQMEMTERQVESNESEDIQNYSTLNLEMGEMLL
jgi:hypothetical protein